jgi:hypothetical protein
MSPSATELLRKTFPKPTMYWSAFNALINHEHSYLYQTGWIRSRHEGLPVNGAGEVIPWMNYAIVRFLQERLQRSFDLFEFGSGYSTQFYARLVRTVTSVEDDEKWFAVVQKMVPENATVIFKARDVDGQYCRAVLATGRMYDTIVVDGRDRVNCVKQSFEALAPQGVILLDDSEREQYCEAIDYARSRGFRVLHYEGMKPVDPVGARTSIFYRPDNCFGI